jgi:hypothetical protein
MPLYLGLVEDLCGMITSTMFPSGNVGASRLSNSTTADFKNVENFLFVRSNLLLPVYSDKLLRFAC